MPLSFEEEVIRAVDSILGDSCLEMELYNFIEGYNNQPSGLIFYVFDELRIDVEQIKGLDDQNYRWSILSKYYLGLCFSIHRKLILLIRAGRAWAKPCPFFVKSLEASTRHRSWRATYAINHSALVHKNPLRLRLESELWHLRLEAEVRLQEPTKAEPVLVQPEPTPTEITPKMLGAMTPSDAYNHCEGFRSGLSECFKDAAGEIDLDCTPYEATEAHLAAVIYAAEINSIDVPNLRQFLADFRLRGLEAGVEFLYEQPRRNRNIQSENYFRDLQWQLRDAQFDRLFPEVMKVRAWAMVAMQAEPTSPAISPEPLDDTHTRLVQMLLPKWDGNMAAVRGQLLPHIPHNKLDAMTPRELAHAAAGVAAKLGYGVDTHKAEIVQLETGSGMVTPIVPGAAVATTQRISKQELDIFKAYQAGAKQTQIARKVGLSQPQVSRAINKVKRHGAGLGANLERKPSARRVMGTPENHLASREIHSGVLAKRQAQKALQEND